MSEYRVQVIEEAERDLIAICRYIAAADSPSRAEQVFDRLTAALESLSTLPLRGHVPPELERIGAVGFREIHWKPYRILYEVSGGVVFIHAILDGRRDMESLLAERLRRRS